MFLSRTFLVYNEILVKNLNFLLPNQYLSHCRPVGDNPLKFYQMQQRQKNILRKLSDDRLNTIPATDGQTDRQTDRIELTEYQYLAVLSCGMVKRNINV